LLFLEDSLVDYIAKFVDEFVTMRQAHTAADWTIPEPPPPPPELHSSRIKWKFAPRPDDKKTITLDQLRVQLPEKMMDYATSNDMDDVLLIKVAAGGGKTYSGVQVAQDCARDGMRVLWAADRHNLFEDLQRLPHFEKDLWYHWLPIHRNTGDFDPIPTTCRYNEAMRDWTQKGYRSSELCKQVCSLDKHIQACPYRVQKKRKEPIIFAMHNHLASGLSIDDFDLVIVDELPLNAFIEEREIPLKNIRIPGTIGPIDELTKMLVDLCGHEPHPLSGKPLLDKIGDILRDVFAQVEVLPDTLPLTPIVTSPEDVGEQPYWYIMNFLKIASLEYEAWRSDWPDWIKRIRLDKNGVHLIGRKDVWEKLPRRMIVLDFTANRRLYQQIFTREIEEFHPLIKRFGKIFQVTGRLNGISTLYDSAGKEETNQAKELLATAKQIASSYSGRVGIICNKLMRPIFDREFGEDNVQHFHAMRGTNILEDVECLIVAGNPAINYDAVVNIAVALNPARITPYGKINEKGNPELRFHEVERGYHITHALYEAEGNKTPWRKIRGLWDEHELQVIEESFRGDELLQAVHRCRPNVSPNDAWVLTSTPMEETIDGIWDDPPISPKGIPWKVWLRLLPCLEKQYENGASISAYTIAEAVGLSPKHVRHNEWINAIAIYEPERWELNLIPVRGGSQKTISPKPC